MTAPTDGGAVGDISLRDYAAIHLPDPIAPDAEPAWLVKCHPELGAPPDDMTDHRAWSDWWVRAEMVLRLKRADAFLAARESAGKEG